MRKTKRVNTRTKLILALIFSIIFSTTNNLYILSFGLAAVLFIINILKKIKFFIKYLNFIIPMILFFGILTFFLEGFQNSIFSSLRLLDIFLVFFILFITTDIEDIADTFSSSGLPYHFTFILITGFNFVPVITARIKNIFDAQCARGINLDNKFFLIFKLNYFFPQFLIQTFRLAEDLAESIETRGFGLIKNNSRKKNKFNFIDLLLIFFSIALLFFYLYYSLFKKPTFS